jgi:hypothetical protein
VRTQSGGTASSQHFVLAVRPIVIPAINREDVALVAGRVLVGNVKCQGCEYVAVSGGDRRMCLVRELTE